MFKQFFKTLAYFGFLGLLISSAQAMAQPDASAQLAQDDIASFVRVYGSANPSAAVAGVDMARLGEVVRRVSVVYVLRGQMGDETALLARLAALRGADAVSQADYGLYMANESQVRPICEKFLGSYTYGLPDQAMEQASTQTQPSLPQPAVQVVPGDQPSSLDGDAEPASGQDPAQAPDGTDHSAPLAAAAGDGTLAGQSPDEAAELPESIAADAAVTQAGPELPDNGETSEALLATETLSDESVDPTERPATENVADPAPHSEVVPDGASQPRTPDSMGN
jgi:hypothetical protein